jgi:Fe-S-cluster containining protein
MDINFDCTMCGKCCHDLKIPLSVEEAIDWLSDGNEVQILTEAVPWPDEADAADVQMNDKRARSFLAMSGSLPTRIVVILAASFGGPCPNLGPEMQCRIYQRRPLVCRIYPAEISSHVEFVPADKKCPPEAWGAGRQPFFHRGKVVDLNLQNEIEQMNAAAISNVSIKQKLCAALDINTASW